jgi:hypothetical protein
MFTRRTRQHGVMPQKTGLFRRSFSSPGKKGKYDGTIRRGRRIRKKLTCLKMYTKYSYIVTAMFYSTTILWYAFPLLGNDREISRYTTAVA